MPSTVVNGTLRKRVELETNMLLPIPFSMPVGVGYGQLAGSVEVAATGQLSCWGANPWGGVWLIGQYFGNTLRTEKVHPPDGLYERHWRETQTKASTTTRQKDPARCKHQPPTDGPPAHL